jgi:DNA-damage-inducible protein D
MDIELIQQLFGRFESIRLMVEDVECWSARELQVILGYSKWDNFVNVIDKAKEACLNTWWQRF